MNINKKTKLRDDGWRYIYEGNLISEEDIDINLDKPLCVAGYIKTKENIRSNTPLMVSEYIETGGYIEIRGGPLKAEGYIKASDSIEVDSYIQSGGYIDAGVGYISAGGSIEAKKHIKAGLCIEAGPGIKAGDFIHADWYIQSAEDIEAGGTLKAGIGILAQSGITAKHIKTRGKIFAGVCISRESTDEDMWIICEKFEGEMGYGILKPLSVRKD